MATGDTDVSVVNQAILLLGSTEISSFDDGSEIAGLSEKIYPHVRDATLSMYPWTFAVKKVQLQRLAAAPLNEWRYAFQIPADLITGGVRAVFNSSAVGANTIRNFEISADQLLTDETTIYVDYVFRPLEAEMPAYFVQLLVYQMAWHLAEPVTDQITKMEAWRTIAIGSLAENGRGGYFRQAMSIDGQGTVPRQIENFDIADVR